MGILTSTEFFLVPFLSMDESQPFLIQMSRWWDRMGVENIVQACQSSFDPIHHSNDRVIIITDTGKGLCKYDHIIEISSYRTFLNLARDFVLEKTGEISFPSSC